MSEMFAKLVGSNPDPRTLEIYDVYRRAVSVYQQANVARGRSPKITVTTNTTQSVIVGHDSTGTTKVSHHR
jgi:hypothetical protein